VAAKRTVPVEVLGKEYRIRSDADPEIVRRAAALVDETIRKVRDRTSTVDTVDVAVLAALNLASHVVMLRESDGVTGVSAERMADLVALLESAVAEPSATTH
jgi:cell division protein ZapA